ncbi:MAG: hypothetical protein AB7F86_02340 [Bdellovibrionales bacterium]
MKLVVGILSLLIFRAWAQAPASDATCSPEIKKTLRSQEILNRVSAGAKFLNLDCAVVTLPKGDQYVLAAIVLNSKTGMESFAVVFPFKGLGKDSKPVFQSPQLAFDLYPLWADEVTRLLFVEPVLTGTKMRFFLNGQHAPSLTRVMAYELDFNKLEFKEDRRRSWPMECGLLPKFYQDRDGQKRILLGARSVPY